MADWAADENGVSENGQWDSRTHSRHSSASSGRSAGAASDHVRGKKGKADENDNIDGVSVGSASSSSGILLADGLKLGEESNTEHRHTVAENGLKTNGSISDSAPRIPTREPQGSSKMKKPAPPVPVITTTAPVESIPEEDITIPHDGCLINFTADEMATFFRYLRIEDRLINHMHRKGLDGKRFAHLKDSEMESVGLNNPVMKFFRDKSMKKVSKGRMNFLL